MAGIYTQQRSLTPAGDLSPATAVWNASGLDRSRESPRIFSAQATTSYRTGRGESLVSASELAANNSSLNNLLQTKGVTYDTGHAFSTVKKEAFVDFPKSIRVSGDKRLTFNCPYVTQSMYYVSEVHYPTIPKWASVNSDGNQAILETYPTRPKVALAQTVAELKREGLPSLFGAQIASMKGSAHRAIGGEFLNSVFGWTPLIADLDKLLKSVVSSSQTIQQLRRDSGRLVRRKYHFPTTTELVSSTALKTMGFGLVSDDPATSRMGTLTIEETRVTKRWFSGAYTYFIDPGDTLVGKAIMYEQLASKLLGLRLTPETLWELAPWSWLVDWYANIGKNISVASAFQQDKLVLKYGYVMRQVTASKLYTFTPDVPHKDYPVSRLVLRTTSKEREKSSPFGFGLSVGSFNDRQWAILAALGLTKAPRTLR